MTDLTALNKNQRTAVEKTDGPLMILAGAGSGKTRTLVSKVSYLLNEKQVSPYQLLALTFSNKAAREMRERISIEVECDLGSLQITTFHSFCAKCLRNEANYLGLSRNFTIYDTSDSKAVVKTLLAKRGISTKELSPFDVLNFIDDLKNKGHYKGRSENVDYEVDEEDEFITYYEEYETELRKSNAIDFGGLISGVIQLFETHPEVLKRYQDRYNYILVDEYQDTNRAQFELIKMISALKKNICVVGDEDQSIYSWRGADIRNILDFEETYPEVEVLKLEQNYRSSKTIIEAASCVISRNSLRKGKEMWTKNPDGDCIEVIECQNDKSESEFISQKIQELVKEKSALYSDCAIFYRTNSQSRIIEDSLRKDNLPYRVVGGTKFYDRKEIKDLLAYLRIVINEKDPLAVSRIINVPARRIGTTTLRKLEGEALSKNLSFWEVVDSIVENPEDYSHLRLSAKVKSGLGELSTVINEAKALDNDKTVPSEIFEKILYESGYFEHLKASRDYESMARLENLEELGNAIKQFESSNQGPTLSTFLETITLDSTASDDDEESKEQKSKGEICLMTVHGAKGLEFPYVFISGVEENVFPSYRSLDEGETMLEEERRLFYVAMTRAMEKLFICFAQGRMLFGQVKFNGPSRFLFEIPDKFYNWINIGKSSEEESEPQGDWDPNFSQETDYNEKAVYQIGSSKAKSNTSQKTRVQAKYPKGSKIAHSLYGEGKVLDSDGIGSEEKVVIKFKDGSKKKFMVKFAPLTLL